MNFILDFICIGSFELLERKASENYKNKKNS